VFASPFFRRLFLPYLLLICLATGAVGLAGARRLRESYIGQTTVALRHHTQLISRIIDGDDRSARAMEVTRDVQDIGRSIDHRITIISADGAVIADNEADSVKMDNHRLRPEIMAAATNGEGISIRDSGTLREGLLYFARRIDASDGKPVYYIRVAVHLGELDRQLYSLYSALAIAVLVTTAAAGALCFHFAKRSSVPIIGLTRFAESLAQGNLSKRLQRTGTGEVGTLAVALNTMADSLSRLIDQTTKDNAELLAILSTMNEGVIAIDGGLKILLVNEAAGRLLDFAEEQAQGRLLWEVVRAEPMLRGINEALKDARRATFQMGAIAGRHLVVTASPLTVVAPQGLVLVIHDETESVRYQDLRKEFVANVSHELRTPLTAIRGFAEALRDGAMEDPERASRYLATIVKNADQLTNLVADLLDLSRLDDSPGLSGRVEVDVASVVRRAVELLQPVAEKKRHALRVNIHPGLPPIDGNPDFLERAVLNLLENAIKYTPEGGQLSVEAAADEVEIQIKVTDNGIGIPADDIPRIFERFYRVDRSRSREMGGTGLGLSIVKHVIQAHGGSVEVTSTPGTGSTFILRFPRASIRP
jgi:two-component system phosphate regulon sensor histidine kinase PhoR